MRLHTENKLIETEDVKLKCGIFQGDSLSPLLFCICLIPPTEQLNRLNTGYEEHIKKTKISHVLYMDDLKLIAKSEEELQKQIQTVKIFSDDIQMEFGLQKCTKIAKRRQTSSLAKFGDRHQKGNTRARTGKNVQVTRD